jgi:hypothetical protein
MTFEMTSMTFEVASPDWALLWGAREPVDPVFSVDAEYTVQAEPLTAPVKRRGLTGKRYRIARRRYRRARQAWQRAGAPMVTQRRRVYVPRARLASR